MREVSFQESTALSRVSVRQPRLNTAAKLKSCPVWLVLLPSDLAVTWQSQAFPLSVLFVGVAEWATVFRTGSTNGEAGRNILCSLRRFKVLLSQQLHPGGFYFLSPSGISFSLLCWTLCMICISSSTGCKWFNKLCIKEFDVLVRWQSQMLKGFPPTNVTKARAVEGRRWPSVVRKTNYSAKPHPLLN